MKRLLLLSAIVAGALSSQAETYGYLTFETIDGSKASVPVSSLEINISGATLTAGNRSFALADLSKMYFSASDMSGIATITVDELDENSVVYDLNGRRVDKDQLTTGVYLVKNKDGFSKIAVK